MDIYNSLPSGGGRLYNPFTGKDTYSQPKGHDQALALAGARNILK